MFGRVRKTSVETISGCFVCHGAGAVWQGKNAMAVAARHHDQTGHMTWVEQHLTVRYGEDGSDKQPGEDDGS